MEEKKETFSKGDSVIPDIDILNDLSFYDWKTKYSLLRDLFQTQQEDKIFKVQFSDENSTKLYGLKEPIENKYIKKVEVRYEDASGKPLNINDAVLYIRPNNRELVKGYIIRLGPKQASVGDEPNAEYTIGRDYSYIAKI